MFVYTVVGWPMVDSNDGWATFQREYKRKGYAEKIANSMIERGDFRMVMLRQKEVLLDTEKNYVSIDGPIKSFERDESGKITTKTWGESPAVSIPA